MNKLLLTTSAILLAISTNAQKDYSKKIESKYISLPSYDISETDPLTVGIEFAMKVPVFGTEKLKEAESTCIPKGGKLSDAIKVPSFYYEIPYTQPESYIVAKSAEGTVVYAAKPTSTQSSNLKFGWDAKMKQPLCEYFRSEKLKKDYASNGSSFKTSEHKKYESKAYTDALAEATANVYLSYFEEEFPVYGAKGKAYDYADLEGAFEKATAAYKSIKKNGLNADDFTKLKEAITVWESELETLNVEDKKARISKNIGKGLHENCVRAYAYMFEFDKALDHGKSFMALFGNFSNNQSNAVKDLILRIRLQSMAADKNSEIIKDIAALHTKASASGKTVNAAHLSSDQFERLSSEYRGYGMSVAVEANEVQNQEEEEAIASGELNPYQKYVSDVAVGGPALMMTMPPSALSGFPELTELPKEMCELTQLTQILIMNNKLETVSPDIAKLTLLKKLDLTGNQLKTLPPEIGKLANLETLKLSKNPIESLPKELGNCTKLKTLVIKGTKLSDADIDEIQSMLPKCKIKN